MALSVAHAVALRMETRVSTLADVLPRRMPRARLFGHYHIPPDCCPRIISLSLRNQYPEFGIVQQRHQGMRREGRE
jgi:hypothetical protein